MQVAMAQFPVYSAYWRKHADKSGEVHTPLLQEQAFDVPLLAATMVAGSVPGAYLAAHIDPGLFRKAAAILFAIMATTIFVTVLSSGPYLVSTAKGTRMRGFACALMDGTAS
jgi:uncharacterized membrane protein YfcA